MYGIAVMRTVRCGRETFPFAWEDKTSYSLVSYGMHIMNEWIVDGEVNRARAVQMWPRYGNYGWVNTNGVFYQAPMFCHYWSACMLVDLLQLHLPIEASADDYLASLGWLHSFGDDVYHNNRMTQAQLDWLFDNFNRRDYNRAVRHSETL